MIKPQIENLRALMHNIPMNQYQKADAFVEFNKLLEYVEYLEDELDRPDKFSVSISNDYKLIYKTEVEAKSNQEAFVKAREEGESKGKKFPKECWAEIKRMTES